MDQVFIHWHHPLAKHCFTWMLTVPSPSSRLCIHGWLKASPKLSLRQGLGAYIWEMIPRNWSVWQRTMRQKKRKRNKGWVCHCTGYRSGTWGSSPPDPLRNPAAYASDLTSEGIPIIDILLLLERNPGDVSSPKLWDFFANSWGEKSPCWGRGWHQHKQATGEQGYSFECQPPPAIPS